MEVESKLDVAKFELTNVVEVKTTANEGMAFAPTVKEQIAWSGAGARYTPWF